ncbi:ABC transporter substrate-binding protein [Haladaptatus sp. NG-WS-4]
MSRSPIHFGALLPLSASGFLGTIAEHHRHAVERAVTDVNRAGGSLDRPIELTVEDTELDPKRAKKAFDSPVDAGVVGFVGPVVSDISLALSEKLASDGVIGISPSSTHPALATTATAKGTKYFARTAANDNHRRS